MFFYHLNDRVFERLYKKEANQERSIVVMVGTEIPPSISKSFGKPSKSQNNNMEEEMVLMMRKFENFFKYNQVH